MTLSRIDWSAVLHYAVVGKLPANDNVKPVASLSVELDRWKARAGQ